MRDFSQFALLFAFLWLSLLLCCCCCCCCCRGICHNLRITWAEFIFLRFQFRLQSTFARLCVCVCLCACVCVILMTMARTKIWLHFCDVFTIFLLCFYCECVCDCVCKRACVWLYTFLCLCVFVRFCCSTIYPVEHLDLVLGFFMSAQCCLLFSSFSHSLLLHLHLVVVGFAGCFISFCIFEICPGGVGVQRSKLKRNLRAKQNLLLLEMP